MTLCERVVDRAHTVDGDVPQRGGYDRDAEWWKTEKPAQPDVVIGFNIEAYTCSWRKSLVSREELSTGLEQLFLCARGN